MVAARRHRRVPLARQPRHPDPGSSSPDSPGFDARCCSHAPSFEDIVDELLLAALEGCVFVAHNARFDWAFVSTEVERARGLLLQGPRVCTVRLARKLLPDLPAPKSRHRELPLWDRNRGPPPRHGDAGCGEMSRHAWLETWRIGDLTCGLAGSAAIGYRCRGMRPVPTAG